MVTQGRVQYGADVMFAKQAKPFMILPVGAISAAFSMTCVSWLATVSLCDYRYLRRVGPLAQRMHYLYT